MGYSYDDARVLDQTAYDLAYSEFPRSLNRAKINALANGEPPFDRETVEQQQIKTNVSDLSLTRLCHDARSQYSNGLMTQENYFTCRTNNAPKHKRDIHSLIVQKEVNKVLKESVSYFESFRSKIGSLVLHGIAPAVWENKSVVVPRAIGVEDVLIPSQTLLGFENLPFFVLRRSFTAKELQDATQRTKRDPGWNTDMVDRCISWVDREMLTTDVGNWPELWAPEKREERNKQDSGAYSSDTVPTIDCFDFYGYVEATSKQPAGWVRRIILDTWSQPGMAGTTISMNRDETIKDSGGKSLAPKKKKDFLYTSGDVPVADNWQKIISFQFADLSAVAPYRYHSVRSLGWMLYAPCHIGNRLKCRFYDSVFEALMQLFRVDSEDDMQRALKADFYNMGVIDKSIQPIPAQERWQPNANLVELGIQMNQNTIDSNSKSYTGQPSPNNKERETNLQRMADLQAINVLTSASLQQAYSYMVFEYRENFRRLLIKDSKDPKARAVQAACLRKGVSEKTLYTLEDWEVQSEKMMGGGNQTLEMMIGQELMKIRQLLDPEPQRIVLRNFIALLTKNPAKANELVPESPAKGTPSMHDASLVAGTLMQGIPVEVQTGINHIEYVETMLKILAGMVQKGMKSPTKTVPAKDLQGMMAIAQNIGQHIKIIAQDPAEKQRVKKYGDILGKLGNELKAFAQRLQAQMKKQQEAAAKQNGHGDPKAAAQAQASIIMAKTKSEIAKESHAQKTAQRHVSFQQKQQQDAQKHQADIAAKDLETAASIRRGGFKAFDEDDES